MQKQHIAFEAIGTHWTIMVRHDLSESSWSALERSIHARIESFDKTYSRFRDDSLVSEMARRAGRHELPAEGYSFLSFYEQLYRATDGQVTPLIGRVVSDAGYDADYSLQPQSLQQPPAWDDVIKFTEKEIILSQPALLDFGAAGKGYLVDIVSDLLVAGGVTNYYVNAGGDIIYRTTDGSPLRVGLENPNNREEVIGVATIHNQSICASAGSRRQWGKYSHIINPQTLESPQEVAATWVIAADTMTADGLATAVYFTSPEKLRKQFDFSYVLLNSDMSIEHTRDFPAKLFKDRP